MMSGKLKPRPRAAILIGTLGVLISSTPALVQAGDNPNPDVVRFSSEYAELSEQWWKWALEQPVTPNNPRTTNPLIDTTGVAAHNGQPFRSDIFFLGGLITFNSGLTAQAERKVTIPPGKKLFFPILNFEQDNVGVSPPLSVAELRQGAAFGTTQVTSLFASIDDLPLQDLASYRAISPVFEYRLPPNHPDKGSENLLYFVTGGALDLAGKVKPAVADGFYLLLKPLSPGHHKVHFGGTSMTLDGNGNPATFQLDITYHIHVRP